MEILFSTFSAKYNRTSTGFVREMEREIEWDAPLVCIRGPRGVGKTTLLLQHIKLRHKLNKSVLYTSLDNIWFNAHSVYELATNFARNGGEWLFLDEVHKYPNWSQELKNIYDDMPDLHVVFTGSSLLHILNSRADLSRRAVVYDMQGFSLREYLNWTLGRDIPKVTLEQMLRDHTDIATEVLRDTKVLGHFDDYLRHGYYPFYKELPSLYHSRLAEVVNMVLEVEIPQLRDVETAYISKIKQLLYVIAESVPFVPNITKISERIGISRAATMQYLNALHDSRILFALHKCGHGLNRIQKPDKLYMDNTNLSFALIGAPPLQGTLRETFFANQLRYEHEIEMAEKGDFLIDGRYTFEIGGKDKGVRQIEGLPDAYIVSDDLEYGMGNRIPLWMFGLLY